MLFEVKAAWLILLWNLIIVTSLSTFFDPSFYVYSIDSVSAFEAVRVQSFFIIPALYGISAFLLLFYPLAGCLADIRWGRYKTIVSSVRVILWSFTLTVLFSGTMVVVMFAYGYIAVVKDVVLLSVPFIPGVIISSVIEASHASILWRITSRACIPTRGHSNARLRGAVKAFSSTRH